MNKLGKSQTLLATTTRRISHCSSRSYHHCQSNAVLSRHRLSPLSPKTYLYTFQQVRVRNVSFAQQAKDLNQKGVDNQLHDYDAQIAEDKEKQRKAPWHREGSDKAPVHTQREAGAMTKGKTASAESLWDTCLQIKGNYSQLLLAC